MSADDRLRVIAFLLGAGAAPATAVAIWRAAGILG